MQAPKYYELSFFPRTVSVWNELPSDTISAQNVDMFKHNIVPRVTQTVFDTLQLSTPFQVNRE